ncbi:hypothetical protein [Cupriavidus sp. SW-Y-13]|uniref:WD40/YVTN/BNR-like repeat-containing protein n=1 Tax=Cupriavidus sp. SW-Y-13 TaxID=2653854 RepID=UPI00136556B4|nr:hypothetical protein [Cupriavidus sp. SW-Y-13]MWL88015.1 hypothetical protein [Cupriavidus sp. SW-Y-13]
MKVKNKKFVDMKKITDRISFDVIVPAIFALVLLTYPFELVRVRFNLFAQDMKPVEVWKGAWDDKNLGYPETGCSSLSRIGGARFVVLKGLAGYAGSHTAQLESLVDVDEDWHEARRKFNARFSSSKDDDRRFLVWRVDALGNVKLVATSPEKVCMTTAPDGAIYARTGIAVQSGEGGHERLSDAVFRSDDGGNTWSYHSADWGGRSIGLAWGVDVVFSDSTNVWAYNNKFDSSGPAMSHSMDQGRTWRVVEEINAAEAAVLKQIAPEANLAFFDREMVRTLFVNEDKSIDLWMSGKYHDQDDRFPHGLVTQRISLRETTNGWAVSAQHHYPGVYVKFIEKDAKGVLRGVVRMGGDQWIGTFNPISDRWEKTVDLPTLFWKPMSSFLRVDKAYFTENVWVIQPEDTHRVSRWIFPWSDAEISSYRVWLYSTDQGASWIRLSNDPFVVGFDKDLGRLYVVENWPDKMLGFLQLAPVDEAKGNLPDLSKSM